MNILDLLKKDHEAVKNLFNKLFHEEKKGHRKTDKIEILTQKIVSELIIHTALEEEIFYPEIRKHKEAKSLISLAYEEHHLVNKLIEEIQAIHSFDERWFAKMKILHTHVTHHIDVEEKELFPQVKNILANKELEDMVTLAQKFKVVATQDSVTTNIPEKKGLQGYPSYVDRLNSLLEYLHDSSQCFEECAKQTSEKHFKKIFEELSQARKNYITDLSTQIKKLHCAPADSGHFIATTHRFYMNVRNFFTSDDVHEIAHEIKDAEQILLDQYQEALRDLTLPPHMQQLLHKQMEETETSLSQIELEAHV